jgi:hypothetical protein
VSSVGPTSAAALVRTDYSDHQAWERLRDDILAETEDGFRACVEVIDEPAFDGLSPETIRSAARNGYQYGFIIIADRVSVTSQDRSVLVIDLFDQPGRTFRAVPAAIQAIENNLSIANLSFFEFADHVDADGIFRGFPPHA